MALSLPRLIKTLPIIDPQTGQPTYAFMQWLDQFAKEIEAGVDAVTAAQNAADTAQTAADAAQAAADSVESTAKLWEVSIFK